MTRLIVCMVMAAALVVSITAAGFYRWGWASGVVAGRQEIIGQYSAEIATLKAALEVDDIKAALHGRGR